VKEKKKKRTGQRWTKKKKKKLEEPGKREHRTKLRTNLQAVRKTGQKGNSGGPNQEEGVEWGREGWDSRKGKTSR